jgi:hypothetical protein
MSRNSARNWSMSREVASVSLPASGIGATRPAPTALVWVTVVWPRSAVPIDPVISLGSGAEV